MQQKRTQKGILKRAAALLLSSLLAAGAIRYAPSAIAMFQEADSAHINADEIEDATLIVGTHLIYLGSLTDGIYQIALQSAQESAQGNTYYKSELADGTWYEISSAASLGDIMAGGKAVKNTVINELYMTHHTKSDGITYDLKTNAEVSPYDINPIYDQKNMSELSELKKQYDLLKNGGGTGEGVKRDLGLIEDFFMAEVSDETTGNYDEMLLSLTAYVKDLMANGGDKDQRDIVNKVMDKIDDSRRFEVLTKLADKLSALLEGISAAPEGSEDEYVGNGELQAAVSTSQSDVDGSKNECEGNMLGAGATTMTKVENNLIQELAESAKDIRYDDCNEMVQNLVHLYHIAKGQSVSGTGEITLMDNSLIPQAKSDFMTLLFAGEDGLNNNGISNDNDNQNNIEMARNELQFYVGAKAGLLVEVAKAKEFITACIDEATQWQQQISANITGTDSTKADSTETNAMAAVESYVAWNQTLLSQITGTEGLELSVLYDEKQALSAGRLAALDQEDLSEANRLEALVQVRDDQIAEKEAASAKELSSLEDQKTELSLALAETAADSSQAASLMARITDIDTQLALINGGLNDGSASKNIQDMKGLFITLMESGSDDSGELSQCIDGIGAQSGSNPKLAGSALKALHQKMVSEKYLKDTSQFDALISKAEELIMENEAAFTETVSSKEVTKVVEEELGIDLDKPLNLDNPPNNEEMGSVLVGLDRFNEQAGSDEIQRLISGLSQAYENTENSNVFLKVNQITGTTYAPADAVASFSSYRYVWNDSKKKAILASGSNYYEFRAFQKTVGREKGKTEELTAEVLFQATVYLPSDYIEKEFGGTVYYIRGTDYGVLVDKVILEKASSICDALLAKGGN